MASIHVRIDDKLKRDVQKILRKIGLDVSSAVKLYLHQIVLNEEIPLRPCAHPVCMGGRLPPELDKKLWEEEQEALKEGKTYASAEELHRDILGEDYAR